MKCNTLQNTNEGFTSPAPGYPGAQKIYAAEIIFGSPMKNCAGSGICKVNSPISHQSGTVNCLNCNRAVALVSREAPATLVFRFVRQSMGKEVIQKYFEDDIFVVEAPFQFSKNHWQEAAPATILPGIYTVERSGEYLAVRFRMG